jgi:hypothetical protein
MMRDDVERYEQHERARAKSHQKLVPEALDNDA